MGGHDSRHDTGEQGAMVRNSLGMIGGRAASMAFGFLFWLLAARLFPPSKVGLTAGVVSAMMLCTQLALLGIGSAFIAHFPRHKEQPASLLDTAVSIVIVASIGAGIAFLLTASFAFDQLRVVDESPLYIAAFLAMCVLGTVNILLDQVSIAIGKGAQVLTRNVVFGGLSVVLLVSLRAIDRDASSITLFSLWVGAGTGACALGAYQLWHSVDRYTYRPRLERALRFPLVRTGLPNHALTLTERAPGLALPIVVTELLSPTANAFWYAVWMMAWVVYIIPISMGMALFAEASHRPESLARAVRSGVRASLLIGAVSAAGLAVLANPILSILGGRYAAAGATPLRILLIAFLPLTLVQVYFNSCRATRRLGEAIATGAISGAIALVAAALVARTWGLAGMAWTWVATQYLTGAWALLRLRALSRLRAEPEADLDPAFDAGPLAVTTG
jgi:O-antigen/teichoic acid export membrane protein